MPGGVEIICPDGVWRVSSRGVEYACVKCEARMRFETKVRRDYEMLRLARAHRKISAHIKGHLAQEMS